MSFQIARIQAIHNEFPVKIDIDVNSKQIQIEGQAESVTSAVDTIHTIFLQLEKDARSKLEAEFISKEVTRAYRFLYLKWSAT